MDVGDTYFRSVYTAIKPNDGLHDLHARVHDALGVEPRTPKYPHMSLCYIADDDAAERDAYLQALKDEGMMRQEGDGASLQCGEGKEDWVSGVDVDEIWITKCDGPVEGWEVLDRVSVKGKQV